MGNEITLTKEQLDFIRFMSERVGGNSTLQNRVDKCLKNLPVKNSEEDQPTQFHSPKKMIEFLSLFSRDDHFKWYTHTWDQRELRLENLIKNQPKDIKELNKRSFGTTTPINTKTYYQIHNFIRFNLDLTKNYYWTDNESQTCKIGWHSILPLHTELPELPVENLKMSDGRLFKDYIRKFKNSIEFRLDMRPEDRFNVVIRKAVRRYINGAVKIEFTNNFRKIGSEINIYCDIPSLLHGLKLICDWIVDYKNNNQHVTVDVSASEDFYILTIVHHDSYFHNEQKFIHSSGNFGDLRNTLFSVCDLTLIGDYNKNSEECGSIIVYGLEEGSNKTSTLLNTCRIEYSNNRIGGVKYILKLYK